MASRADLAKIHIARKQLGMDEDTYRAMLQSVGGVHSSKDLDDAGATKVLAHLQRSGFKPTKHVGRVPRAVTSNKALMSKIEALLADGGKPWAYAHSMAKRMFGIDKLEWCDHDQLWRIVAALQISANRNG
ncbi:gp16 family protein [Ralstonia mannitolilytica]|uniref:gp16 family protein n=1 Tax=Ralstonia mannitolilytica TaxID=105219 RepID=UPI000CEEF118|nr:regulatory protein GemA [Ralstonia mannitolilytica]